MHVAHLVHRSAQRHPKRPLWLGPNLRIDYRSGADRMNRISNSLLRLGRRGDRVAILSANRFEAYEIFLAVMNAGMAAVPLNPKLHAAEHGFTLQDAGARLVVFSDDHADDVARLRSYRADVAHWIAIGACPDFASAYESLVTDGEGGVPDAVIGLDDLAWLFYTSGTTGKPKGAMETHRNLITMVQQFRQTILADACETDVMLHAAPIAHGTASVGLAHLSVAAAQTFPLSKAFDPAKIFEVIEAFKVTSSFLAPTMVQMLLQATRERAFDLGSLKNIVYGGGPMYREVLRDAIQTFGLVFSQIYGQGEAPMTCAGLSKGEHRLDDPDCLRRLGSAGREMPGVMLRIADDDDRPLEIGQTGEIQVRSDLVMRGYWNRPEATAETLRGGWLHTGDIGHLDPDGYLFITDRKKDLIISGGSNIYPREVEEVLLAHPAVAEVSVIGVPDAKWGEAVKAVVVCRPGVVVATEDLIGFCRERIASYKKPKSVDFVDALPKSAFGKVLKRELRKPYWDEHTRSI